MKYRIRFGIRLGWPIVNAATFVFRNVPEAAKTKMDDGVAILRLALASMPGGTEIADRIVYDAMPV